MVNNVTSPASKLLEQIQRLSAQTTRNENSHLNHKNNVNNGVNDRTNNVKGLRTVEKTQKKAEVSTQIIEDIKKGNMERHAHISERSKSTNSEKRYREPVGAFLDVYL